MSKTFYNEINTKKLYFRTNSTYFNYKYNGILMRNILVLLIIFYGCDSDSSEDTIQKSNDNFESNMSDSTKFDNENLDSLNIISPNKAIQDSLNNLIATLKSENNNLKSNSDALSENNYSLQSKLVDLEEDKSKLNEQLNDFNTKHDDLSRKAEGDNYKKYSKDFQDNQYSRETKLIILIIVLAICVILSTIASFYLYRWRRILSNKSGKEFIKPENFDVIMTKLIKEFNGYTSDIKILDHNIKEQGQSSNDKISNMINTFMDMRKAIDEREAEIKRLKEGYDSVLYKKFLTRFIRVSQMVNKNLNNKELDVSVLERINNRLLDALEECEVETFSPEVGMNYRKDIDDQSEIECFFESTKDKSKEFQIFEIIEKGYKLIISDEKFEVIIPAQVKVYKQMEEK